MKSTEKLKSEKQMFSSTTRNKNCQRFGVCPANVLFFLYVCVSAYTFFKVEVVSYSVHGFIRLVQK